MTAQELLLFQLDDATNQIRKAVGDPDAEWFSQRLTAQSMTVGEIVTHLAECATAFLDASEGRKTEWGSYRAPDPSPTGLLATLEDLRARARGVAAEASDPELLKEASQYLVLHDAYHVGQLCALRLKLDPTWNAYSIYES